MWMGVDVERPTRVRSSIGTKKLMIWVCFSRCGIGSVVVSPEKEIFTCQFFVDKVLDDFDKELTETRPKKRARCTFCIWTMRQRIGQMMILMVSELQDCPTPLAPGSRTM
jgi:MoaA/NifB/PqqE/SkfB family radical SAM enzyme